MKFGKVFFLLFSILSAYIFISGYVRYEKNFEKRYYPESKVGCLTKYSTILRLECTEQKMSFDVLKSLAQLKRKKSKKLLSNLVLDRAKYFIAKEKYDYYSVLSLMIFPVENKLQWLEKIQSIPGKRAPFVKIALDWIKSKKSKHCAKKKIHLKEICTLKIY